MGEIANCPKCSALFNKTKYRDVCDACFKEEEQLYEMVYKYIRKRENRTATVDQIIEDTGIDEELLIKFIRTGRLKPSLYPNLHYKCEKCGTSITEGHLCAKCKSSFVSELKTFEHEERRKEEIKERERNATYHVNQYKPRFKRD